MLDAYIQSGLLVVGGMAAGLAASQIGRRTKAKTARELAVQAQTHRAQERHLCFSTIEALAYALEASDPYSMGHLDCVQQCALGMARVLDFEEDESAALRAACLLHNVGRLGVPEHIFHKPGSLTFEEQEKLRSHPVLGARIIASIPFPWPVVPLVRHHAEHWDGNGYPDGLRGEMIPLGARILAVANVYSALLRPRPYRAAYSPDEALAEIEARAGTQFDPAVLTAFRAVAANIRADASTYDALNTLAPSSQQTGGHVSVEIRSALNDIASAQKETLGLYTLVQSISNSLHLEAVANNLLACTRQIVSSDACALFLPEDDGQYLRCIAAHGTNERHLLGSMARVGTYLTGRAFARGEMAHASFMPQDLALRDVSDEWTPFRSTLIVPLLVGGTAIGALNLYAETPDAFSLDAQRVLRLVATQASQAIDNARRFTEVQETAYTDALTGLRNARFLREFLEREINRASRDQTSVAVLNIDLDKFKPINDHFGHAMGDQILRDVAEILNTHVRSYDLAARYAGDEFVIVLSRAGRLPAEVVAEKLKRAVERHAHKLMAKDPSFPNLGISIGIALYPEDATDLQGLLCRSDAAMYADKRDRHAERSAA
jgi:diguanylate cyclase (GGDEF)-like protein